MDAVDAVEQHNLGVRLAREQRYGEAIDCFYRAAQAGLVASHKALYATLFAGSRISEAWRAARAYLSSVPHDYAFANQFFGDIFIYDLYKESNSNDLSSLIA